MLYAVSVPHCLFFYRKSQFFSNIFIKKVIQLQIDYLEIILKAQVSTNTCQHVRAFVSHDENRKREIFKLDSRRMTKEKHF